MLRIRLILVAVIALSRASAIGASSAWASAQDSHFEVYSQGGPGSAIKALTHFEELRSFFEQNPFLPTGQLSTTRPPVRVIEFKSREEFNEVKPRALADAYFSGNPDRDFIVMTLSMEDDLGIAAHEYTHALLHAAAPRLPAWLNEGMAERFSTVRITYAKCEVGGPIPGRVQILRRKSWLSAHELLTVKADSPVRQTPEGSALFYAESWALTDLLASSPAYASRFRELLVLLGSDKLDSDQALAQIYGKSAQQILIDAQSWIARDRTLRQTLPGIRPETFPTKLSALSEFEVLAMRADLLFASEQWDRSERAYQDLLRRAPNHPDILASLGGVALRTGDRVGAAAYWHKALDLGLKESRLCYRYAMLAEELGLPFLEIERALERAIEGENAFDDARYRLALLKSNAGDYEAAVNQLQSMAQPHAARAFGYWTALSYALAELGRRTEAETAAQQARLVARTVDERLQASSLAYVAKTDLAVRFQRSSDGALQLVTTRVPHGSTDFNPFVEPEDRLQIATGKLREVRCSGGALNAFLVEVDGTLLTLSVPDPLHVLMRHAPAEFNCGSQDSRQVKVEYAKLTSSNVGLLRGMDFQ